MLRAYHGYGELPTLPGYVTAEEFDRQLQAAKKEFAERRWLLALGAATGGFLLGRWLR